MKNLSRIPINRKLLTAGLPLLVLSIVVFNRSPFLDAADTSDSKSSIGAAPEIVLTKDVAWTPLNPARGKNGPKAGTLWGDRAGARQTGFLVKFEDGFSSPPHIHNITYRGIVISGQIHNDDPGAEEMWMPSGSYWTQPAGEVHITAAKGAGNMAYIEIERGPYLVLPSEQASDNGERPVNIHEANLVWLDAAATSWISHPEAESAADGPQISFLWGKPQKGETTGALLKLPAGFKGEIRSSGSGLRAIVIEGSPLLEVAGKNTTTTLEPGTYFSAQGNTAHTVSAGSEHESIFYIRAEGGFTFAAAQTQNAK